jgi:DNA-binding HxlR family transcriptional regulator
LPMASNETCPVCHTAEIISGKWTLLLIRDLASGCSRFCELERSLEGISPRTLSLRLRALEAEGIIERKTYPEVPPRVEYRLTPKGQALVPLIEQMRRYGREWLAGTRAAEHDRERLEAADAAHAARREEGKSARRIVGACETVRYTTSCGRSPSRRPNA